MLKLKEAEVLYLLEEQLPEMIERDPDLERRLFRAFLRVFTTKEETATILSEMREFRGEFRQFRDRVEDRFGQIDQRLEQVDRRFEQVDQRFEQVDRRFEQVDQHFEQVDRRFEQVDQRFDQVDEQFDALRREISDTRDWVEGIVGGLQRRSGRNLEDVVAGALRVALRRPDIKPDQLRLRQKMVDETGVVGLPGQKRQFEIDILAQNGQISVFEVKSYCKWDDIERLKDKVTFIQALNPHAKVEGIMIAMSIGDDVRERCRELGITLVCRGD